MAAKVRLMNKGKRTIYIGPQKAIAPDAIVLVTSDVADKHLRLYPKELVNLDKIIESDGEQMQDFTKDVAVEDDKPAKGAKVSKKAEAKGGNEDALAAALKDE